MADESDDSEKTEDPTSKRLTDARDQGQVPMSRELGTWANVTMILVVMIAFAPGMAARTRDGLAALLDQAATKSLDPGNTGKILVETLLLVVQVVALPLLLLALASIATTLLQTGGLISAAGLKPKFSKLNPISGLGRLFSANGLLEFGKSVAKMVVIGAIVYMSLRPMLDSVEHFAGIDLQHMLVEAHQLLVGMLVNIVIVLTVIAAADFIYQRWKFTQNLRMSRQDVKEEMKQSEGDPVVKGRLRSLRMQKARQRMMANVPKSDVVVTNPTHFAVALKYDPASMQAPVVMAKGADLVARRIRDLATEHDVPLVENPPLARALYATVEVEQEVPPEHYKAMAEVISYVFRLKRRAL